MAMVVGTVIGGLTFLLKRNYMFPAVAILLGIAGAVIGDVMYFFASGATDLLFSWAGLLSQIVGAAIFVTIFEVLKRASSRPTEEL